MSRYELVLSNETYTSTEERLGMKNEPKRRNSVLFSATLSLQKIIIGIAILMSFLFIHFEPFVPSDTKFKADFTLQDLTADPKLFDSVHDLTALDYAFCGQTPCPLLLPGYITIEQETKSQLHIEQLSFLANMLGRILILPNVERGNYGTCKSHPFELYHAADDVEKLFNVSTLPFKLFKLYACKRALLGAPLAVRMVTVSEPRFNPDLTTEQVNQADFSVEYSKSTRTNKDLLKSLCLNRMGLLSLSYLPFRIFTPVAERTNAFHYANETTRYRFGKYVLDQLKSEEIRLKTLSTDIKQHFTSKDDLIVLDWRIITRVYRSIDGSERGSFAATPIPFHPRWTSIANEHIVKLERFLALQWRMEFNYDQPVNYTQCARDAIEQIREMDNIDNVYFLTDYPLEGPNNPHSTSFLSQLKKHPNLKVAAEAGVTTLLDAFDGENSDLPPLKTLARFAPTIGIGNEKVFIDSIDSGISGIVDELIAESATVYLVGAPDVCGRFSSFTQQIITRRVEKSSQDVDWIPKSIVEYFPTLNTLMDPGPLYATEVISYGRLK